MFARQDVTAIIVGFGLVIAVVVFFTIKSASKNPEEIAAPVALDEEDSMNLPSVSPKEIIQGSVFSKQEPIFDLRTDVEYQAAHIIGAISLPADTVTDATEITEKSIVIVPSADSVSAKKAVDILAKKGVSMRQIEGGMRGWEAAGGRVVVFGNPSSPIDRSKVHFVSLESFKSIVEDTKILHMILDIRSKKEFDRAHVPGAYNIPFSELEKRRAEIPPATNIALYGDNDIESFQASVRLFDMGMFAVKTLDVNFTAWEERKWPVEKKE